ncbi:hypothetical protein SK128_024668, partial [Halocaridina rubra]
ATLKLGNKSCIAKIQLHEGIHTPLLSFGHCQELAIVSPDFPKPVLTITHINRCAELPLPTTTSPFAAKRLLSTRVQRCPSIKGRSPLPFRVK